MANVIKIILFFLILIIGGFFAYEWYNSKVNEKGQQSSQYPICNRDQQNALQKFTCADIASKNISQKNMSGMMMNNEQNIYMRQKGINFNILGHKFPEEVCWSNEIQNCVSQNCLEKNRNAKDIAICKIKENISKYKGWSLFDPGVVNLSKRYNLKESDIN